MVQVLNSGLHNIVDAKEILSRAQSIEGWMMKLELSDSEATLLGWKPELLGD
jgi:glycine cleavage system H lipoate-binding protein